MKRLIEEITIKRPTSCTDCPMGAYDSDNGRLCCGSIRDYGSQGHNIKEIDSPDDALKYGGDCLFVVGDDNDES